MFEVLKMRKENLIYQAFVKALRRHLYLNYDGQISLEETIDNIQKELNLYTDKINKNK